MKSDARSKKDFNAEIAQLSSSVMELQKSLLAQMGTLAATHERTLQREFEHKIKKYGKNSDEAKAIEAQIFAGKTFYVQLRAQAQRADVTIPEGRADRFILHGRLVDSNGLGVYGLIVSGVDCCTQKVLRRSSTDRKGHFKLEFHCVPKRAESAEGTSAESSSADEGCLQFTLQVMNKDQTVLYCDDSIYSIVPGSVIYKEIMITDDFQ